jgi:mannose-6-phosphate isomerase-like protein (cupin superfamily)
MAKQPKKVKNIIYETVLHIETETMKNTDFRRVVHTGEHLQLELVSLKPGEDIGEEVHMVDQFFRVDQGEGECIINGTEYDISDGTAFVVPAGAKHNVIAGDVGLKMYAIYAPPHVPAGTVHATREQAHKAG